MKRIQKSESNNKDKAGMYLETRHDVIKVTAVEFYLLEWNPGTAGCKGLQGCNFEAKCQP